MCSHVFIIANSWFEGYGTDFHKRVRHPHTYWRIPKYFKDTLSVAVVRALGRTWAEGMGFTYCCKFAFYIFVVLVGFVPQNLCGIVYVPCSYYLPCVTCVCVWIGVHHVLMVFVCDMHPTQILLVWEVDL